MSSLQQLMPLLFDLENAFSTDFLVCYDIILDISKYKLEDIEFKDNDYAYLSQLFPEEEQDEINMDKKISSKRDLFEKLSNPKFKHTPKALHMNIDVVSNFSSGGVQLQNLKSMIDNFYVQPTFQQSNGGLHSVVYKTRAGDLVIIYFETCRDCCAKGIPTSFEKFSN